MGSMERSFTDQSTLQEDERMALSFMDSHTCGARGMTDAHTATRRGVHKHIAFPQPRNAISDTTFISPHFLISLSVTSERPEWF